MQNIYANSNEGMVFKLVVLLEQGVKTNPRKPTHIRVDLFQKSSFKFEKKIHFKYITYKRSSFDTWHT